MLNEFQRALRRKGQSHRYTDGRRLVATKNPLIARLVWLALPHKHLKKRREIERRQRQIAAGMLKPNEEV